MPVRPEKLKLGGERRIYRRKKVNDKGVLLADYEVRGVFSKTSLLRHKKETCLKRCKGEGRSGPDRTAVLVPKITKKTWKTNT